MFSHVFSVLLAIAAVTTPQPDAVDGGDLKKNTVQTDGVSWTPPGAPQVNVKASILEESTRALDLGRQPIVYVGAKWCEPCERFKAAVKARKLDRPLANLHFIEFDLDIHRDGLQLAGYQSRMIPLFCLPNPATGTSSGQCIQGSVKGPGAVGNLLPRLKQLLASGANP